MKNYYWSSSTYFFTYFLLYVNNYFLSLPCGPLTSYSDDVDVLVEEEGNHEGEGDGPEERDGDGDTTRSHLTHLTPWRPHYSVVPVTWINLFENKYIKTADHPN